MPGPTLMRNDPACRYAPPRPMTQDERTKAKWRARRGDDPLNPMRLEKLAKHRERVATAQPLVDSKSPMVPKKSYCSPSFFNRSIATFVKVERENARMLERIAIIMKSPATVDNHLKNESRSINARSRQREIDILKIAFNNFDLYKRITSVKSVYSREQQLREFERNEQIMARSSYYPLFWKVPPPSLFSNALPRALERAQMNPRPKVYLQLDTDSEPLGQIVIELRADVVPLTAENFRCLCTGEMGLSYKCSEIHRIVPEYLWQGGDVIGRDGRGSTSIYGTNFPDENFRLKHDDAGIVSMCNLGGKDTNGSQFLITAKELSALDGTNVVVGKVISGMEVLTKLNKFVTSTGSLRKKIWISQCGSLDEGLEGNSEGEYDADDERQKDTRAITAPQDSEPAEPSASGTSTAADTAESEIPAPEDNTATEEEEDEEEE